MRRMILAVALSLICAPLFAQLEVTSQQASMLAGVAKITQIDDVVLVGEGSAIQTRPVVVVFVKTEAANVEVSVTSQSREPVEFRTLSGNRYLLDKPGKYWVEVTAIDFEKNIYGRKLTVVVVGEPGPAPDPTPDPKPPGPEPGPTPGPAPIDGDGLRVAIVYESAKLNKLTGDQRQIFYGSDVRGYLDANCVKGEDGRTPEWRLLDGDTPFTDASNKWAKTLARPRASVPWLVISNGKSGFEGPLPGTPSEVIELIKRYKPVGKAAAKPAPAPVRMQQPQIAPESLARTEQVPRVVMHSTGNCVWCQRWVANELPKLTGVEFGTASGDLSVRLYPTFDIYAGGRQLRLSGYQSAAAIQSEIQRLQR